MDHKNRTGENAYTQVAGSVSFRDYFEKYMSADQQKQWLGPERYKIWQRGNLTLDKFIAPYPDKRLTVDALKDLDKKSFATGTVLQAKGERLNGSTILFHNEDKEYPTGGKYKKLRTFYNSAISGEKHFIEKLQSTNPNIEFAGIWDADKKLFCVAMGEENHVSYRVPLNGATVIHNHPHGTPPSWQDFNEFIDQKLKKMEIVTTEGVFSLTNDLQEIKLPIEKLSNRFFNAIGEREYITFKEWEEVLDGSGYKISYSHS